MKRLLALFTGIALCAFFSQGALAAVVQISVKDAGGTTRTFNVTTTTDITGNLSWNNTVCDQSTGAICASVKAASTAPASTDEALVATLSPNTGEVGTPGTGITQPNGGVGMSGWLSGMYGALTTGMLANTNGQFSLANSAPVAPASDWINDSCFGTNKKITSPISSTATAILIAPGTQYEYTYICGLYLTTTGAESITIVEGTTSSTPCDTGVFVVAGGYPASSGGMPLSLASQQGGISAGSGSGTILSATNAADDNVCILKSGSDLLAGWVSYVQAAF